MKFGFSKGSHFWVNFYHYLAKIIAGNHTVSNGTQCDVFFYSYWNAADALKCKKGTKLVFISGECWNVSKYPCELLIDCKPVLNHSARFLYYPFYALSFFERPNGTNQHDLIKPPSYNAEYFLSQKTRFCAFMYSYDVDFRVQLFDDINSYKEVDALGKSRNKNQTIKTDRGSSAFMDNAVKMYSPYKFVICCENQRAPGYVTEKIINAMLANAIPIYFGAADISNHFNSKSFIDISSFQSRSEAINFIKRVDQDDKLYCSILNEPWFNDNTLPPYFNEQYFQDAFSKILINSNSGLNRSRHSSMRIKNIFSNRTKMYRFAMKNRYSRSASNNNNVNVKRSSRTFATRIGVLKLLKKLKFNKK